MKIEEYKIKHSKALKEFLSTAAGLDLITTLYANCPEFVTSAAPHQHHESAGAVRNHLQLIQKIIFLSLPMPVKTEVEANYGVPEKKKEETKNT